MISSSSLFKKINLEDVNTTGKEATSDRELQWEDLNGDAEERDGSDNEKEYADVETDTDEFGQDDSDTTNLKKNPMFVYGSDVENNDIYEYREEPRKPASTFSYLAASGKDKKTSTARKKSNPKESTHRVSVKVRCKVIILYICFVP